MPREDPLHKVTEAQLREYAAASTIQQQTILSTQDGYVLTFSLTWKPGMFTLFTARSGHPRTFQSVDRMLKYLDKQNLLLDDVTLKLKPITPTPQAS